MALRPFVQAFSPVFFHINANGDLVKGIEGVPDGTIGRPVLLVGNHQLFGTDTPLIIREFLLRKRVLVRGLGHPLLFNGQAPGVPYFPREVDGIDLLDPEKLVKFGGVEVSPAAIFQLLQRNETVLLYPGGANELVHNKGEAYMLKWSSKTDFIRMAAAFNAIVVPFGAIGVDDSFNILLDAKEISELPYFGLRAKRFAARLPRARASVPETFIFPVGFPTPPRRVYVLFQQPFDTSIIDMNNKSDCRAAYANVKRGVEHSIEQLLRLRTKDYYDQYIPRILYENVFSCQAPTVNKLD